MSDLSPGWIRSYDGQWNQETWTHPEKMLRVVDFYAGWQINPPLRWRIKLPDRNGYFYTHGKYLQFYKTAEDAMIAAERITYPYE